MSNRNRSKHIEISSNIVELDDYIEFTADELVALCNSLNCAIAGVKNFIKSNPPADKLQEANEDLAIWSALFDKIDSYLESLED